MLININKIVHPTEIIYLYWAKPVFMFCQTKLADYKQPNQAWFDWILN